MSARFLKTSIRELSVFTSLSTPADKAPSHMCRVFSPSMLENYEENFTVELEHPSNFSGRIRYTFASFWSRNRTFRALEAALQSYEATLEAEKQVLTTSLCVISCSNFMFRYLLAKTNLMFILVLPQTGESTCTSTNRT